MKTVWKFPLRIADHQVVEMPAGAHVVHVGLDPGGQPSIWATVDTTKAIIGHAMFVIGTGQQIPDGDNRHIGSFVDGSFVWHVWQPWPWE
jgi:hypothetical protein